MQVCHQYLKNFILSSKPPSIKEYDCYVGKAIAFVFVSNVTQASYFVSWYSRRTHADCTYSM